MHIFKQYYGERQYFIVYHFVSERKRQVVIEQTWFPSTVFLCSEFTWEYLLSSKFLQGNFFRQFSFAGTYFCGSLKKPQKLQNLEHAKVLCHTVFRSISIPCKLTLRGWNVFYYLWRERVGITPQAIVRDGPLEKLWEEWGIFGPQEFFFVIKFLVWIFFRP